LCLVGLTVSDPGGWPVAVNLVTLYLVLPYYQLTGTLSQAKTTNYCKNRGNACSFIPGYL